MTPGAQSVRHLRSASKRSALIYIYIYIHIRNTLSELFNLSRPIAKKPKPSITTLVSSCLRLLITPIIANSPFLRDDVHEMIALLSHPSINLTTLHTYDIKSFYSSAPKQPTPRGIRSLQPSQPLYPHPCCFPALHVHHRWIQILHSWQHRHPNGSSASP